MRMCVCESVKQKRTARYVTLPLPSLSLSFAVYRFRKLTAWRRVAVSKISPPRSTAEAEIERSPRKQKPTPTGHRVHPYVHIACGACTTHNAQAQHNYNLQICIHSLIHHSLQTSLTSSNSSFRPTRCGCEL